MKFIVKYSEEKDLFPYLNNFWGKHKVNFGTDYFEIGKKYFPSEFIEEVKTAGTKEEAINIIKKHWKLTRTKDFEENTKLLVKWYTKILNGEKDQIIKLLEKAYSEKFPFEDITVYLTTFFSCPYYYEEKWFMVNRNSNLIWLMDASKHELNHFMFYYYWREYLKKQNISDEKIEYLKESFVILTSSNPNENVEKSNIFPIQNFVKLHKDKPIKEIIDLVIKEGLLK